MRAGRCDVVVTRNRAIYINGHRIENVISVDIEQNAMVQPGKVDP